VTGLPTFRIKPSDKFKRSYKELLKRYYKGEKSKQGFIEFVAQVVTNLSDNAYLDSSFAEGMPGNLRLPENWEFRKYYFDMPSLRGASGQGRLMYLVNRNQNVIELVWIYTHSEFEKRPPDKNLKQLMQELIESQPEEVFSDNKNDSELEEDRNISEDFE
jgi:mRNA-degrading endonuclease YafQ of YafQ-DinJ toxin-antitoxin module